MEKILYKVTYTASTKLLLQIKMCESKFHSHVLLKIKFWKTTLVVVKITIPFRALVLSI